MKRKNLCTLLLLALLIAGLAKVNVGSSTDGTKVYVTPVDNVYDPGQRFNVTIYVQDVTSLRTWGARLYFDPTMLSTPMDGSRIWEGTFLPKKTFPNIRTTSFTKKVFPGYVSFGSTIITPAAPANVTGSGSLAIVEFQVIGTGKCNLDLTDTSLQDGYNNLITHSSQDGLFWTHYPRAEFTYSPSSNTAPFYRDPVVGEVITFNASLSYDPDGTITNYSWDFDDGNTNSTSASITYHAYTAPGIYSVNLTVTDNSTLKDWYAIQTVKVLLHDIAITDVKVFPTVAMPGSLVYINITVKNQGTVYENFNVSAYYDNTPILYKYYPKEEKMNMTTSLPNGENATISFIWNTTSVGEGEYTIQANASLVGRTPPYEFLLGLEQNVTNNIYVVDGKVQVTSAPVHDIAVISIQATPTVIEPGGVISIDVKVQNQGNRDETFNATLYYNSTLLNPWPNIDITLATIKTLSFPWNTAGMSAGIYTLSANVTVLAGETDIDDNTFTDGSITISLPPQPSFTYSPSIPLVGQTLTFNASASIDPDGSIVSYKWDFGDGTITTPVTNPITTHLYHSTKTYQVNLTVTDNVGLSATQSKSIKIVAYPVANFTYSPSLPIAGKTTTFNGSSSELNGGSIVSYAWDFDDGNTTTVTTPTIIHVYASYGTYNVTLNVTDSEGLWDIESQSILIRAYPVAEFTCSPSLPIAGETATFDGSSSEPNGGSITSYAWKFGDGNTTTVTTPTIVHVYASYGTYTVVLNVTDSEGLWDIESQSITVKAYPVAAFTYSPQSPKAGETVTFDASDSLPQGGTIVSYTWDFGDGNTTTVSTTIINHTYANPEKFNVTLTVKDSEDLTNTLTKEITVEAAPSGLNIILYAATGIGIIIIVAIAFYFIKSRKTSGKTP